MVQEKYTFPQDHGTDAYPDKEGDPNDAANFGSLVGATQTHSALIRGMTFSNVDYTNLTFDVDAGKVYLVGDGITAASSGENRDEVALVNGVPAQTGKSLTDNAVNHVFAATDPDTNNAPYVTVNDTDTAPADPSVKIGEIDTGNNSTSERWNLITTGGILTFPNESAVDETGADLSAGATLYNRENGEYYKVD